MTIHKVIHGFSDKKDGMKVYKPNGVNNIYIGSDESRNQELSSSKNDIGKPLIKPMTKGELINLAEKHGIEVPNKPKVAELHEVIEGALNG